MEAPGAVISLVLGTRPLDLDQILLHEEALYLSHLAAPPHPSRGGLSSRSQGPLRSLSLVVGRIPSMDAYRLTGSPGVLVGTEVDKGPAFLFLVGY